MPTLTILQGQTHTAVEMPSGATLLEGLRLGGFPHVDAPCGGKGRCGRCLAEVSGQIAPPSPREHALLAPGETRRLACLAVVEGDCTVTLPEGDLKAATEGAAVRFAPDGHGAGLGAAVDVGTTTVVLYLYDRASGARLATASGGNAQRGYGADVISRVQYTMEHPEGLETLKMAIRTQLRQLLAEACAQAGRKPEEVTALSVAGNTVMLHLLAGLDPASIAVAPFTPKSLFGETVSADSYDLGAAPGAELYLAPCVSGYVGGDITAGLVASGAAQAERPVLFVDVGTNGEMALGDRNGLLCCSTAAGPAFEGANLSCGMAAADGAIDKVWLENGTLCYSVLGGGAPAGVCGSGLVDTLAALLQLGIVDETGRLLPADEAPEAFADRLEGEGSETRFRLAGEVWVSAGDVRKLQLAKAAVSAGIQTLMEQQNVTAGQLDAFYLAGGFGSYLRPESAAAIGLFPAELLPVLKVVGNSAGMGASAALLSQAAQAALAETAAKCRYLELSGRADFSDAYIDCMMFE